MVRYMCFSPEASFIAGTGLSGLGIVSARLSNTKAKMMACMPLLFGIQQLSEGFQWLSLRAGNVNEIAGYVFVFFAFLLWPVYVPVTVYFMDEKRRNLTRFFIIAGSSVSLVLAYCLAAGPLFVQPFSTSILYTASCPAFPFVIGPLGVMLYVTATVISLLTSSIRWFQLAGLVVAVSFLVAWFIYNTTFASVWCFFAAILSGGIFYYIWKHQRAAVKAL
ncbi:hypothetical protein HY620_02420 [Candidatus Uhrbacteria bacterium]|nr:hypothetical protein [Candidatus Uhrbacteria bacterium]